MALRRSIFLIDRKFQLRFAFYVCSWLFTLSLIYPLIIYNLFVFFTHYMAQDPHGPAPEALIQVRREVLVLLVVLQGSFLFVTFIISIFTSHRIAGPLYKLKRHFETLKEGHLEHKLFFRKKDHFQDLAEDYNRMVTGLTEHLAHRFSEVKVAIQKIERAKETAAPEAKKQLEEAVTALKTLSFEVGKNP